MRFCAQGATTGADLVTTTHPAGPAPRLPGSVTVLTRGLRNGRCEAVVYDAPSLATLRTQVPSRYGHSRASSAPARATERLREGQPPARPGQPRAAALKRDGTIAALQKRWLTADLSRLPVLR